MGMFDAINISASGLTAQSFRMDVIAQNIANANTTRTADGTPYQRRTTLLSEGRSMRFSDVLAERQGLAATGSGVRVTETPVDESPFKLQYDPTHPDANEEGYVEMPNVDIVREYVDKISASRSYESNITIVNASKKMAAKALEIGK
jgi:flagellar basal-body rod protein FlgC